jgi:acetoin:2,6-dichlorophenolindophenol oxidoreductase subunit alpha
MAKDPLPALRASLIADGHASADQLDKLTADIEAEVADAQEFGMNSPFPDVAELRRDVFAQEIAA